MRSMKTKNTKMKMKEKSLKKVMTNPMTNPMMNQTTKMNMKKMKRHANKTPKQPKKNT